MNPVHKKVPVLIHISESPSLSLFSESLIILEYIDEVWSRSTPLLPADPYDRARARFWADFVNNNLFEKAAFPIWTCTGEAQEEGKRNMLEYLGLLEGALKELSGGVKPYFGGDQFGFLDIVFIPFASWFHAWETMGDWKIPFDTEFPRLHEWVNACMERKALNMNSKKRISSPRPLLLQMKPVHKKIPVLIHNGKPVCESLIILQYIDEAWPSSNPLLPSNPYDRARARFWADFVDKKIHGNSGSLIIRCRGEAQEQGKRNMLEYLGLLEGALNELSGGIKPYFGGDQFGFMDIAFIPFAFWLHGWGAILDWKIPLDTQFPRLHEWVNTCMERDSVKKILPHPQKLTKYAIEMRKRFLSSE